jgi:integrase
MTQRKLIYKQAGSKFWYTNVRIGGKRKRVSTGETDENLALLKATQLKAGQRIERTQALGEVSADASSMTVDEAIRRAWREEWHELRDKQMKTLHGEELKTILGKDFQVRHIDRDKLLDLRDHWTSEGNSPGTVNRKLSFVSRLLHLAASSKWRVIAACPEIPRMREPKGRTHHMSSEQQERVIDKEEDDACRAFWLFLADVGARSGESLALTWADLDLRKGAGMVAFAGDSTKSGKGRAIPLSDRTVAALLFVRDTLKLEMPFGWRSYEWWRAKFIEALARANVPKPRGIALHLERHTCATLLLDRDADVRDVQEWLGHGSIKVTERYTHVVNNRLRRVAERVYSSRPVEPDGHSDATTMTEGYDQTVGTMTADSGSETAVATASSRAAKRK